MSKGGLFNRYKFIDDYIVTEELNANGKKIKKAYYNAEYYETVWNDRQAKAFKLTVITLSVICLVISAVPLSVYHDAMFVMYVVLAFAASTIFSLLMLGSALHLPGTGAPMERSQKHFGFERLRIRALINGFLGLYGALINAVYSFVIYPKNAALHGEVAATAQYPGVDVLVSVCGLLIAAASYYCVKKLKTADIHLSAKESEGKRIKRELEEKEASDLA